MNKIIDKLLLTGDTFMLELQAGFTCGPFTKHCERIQSFKTI